MGSEFLRTIVPMSGLIGVHDLMWRNGSMEARGAIMHNGVYGSFGLDGDLDEFMAAALAQRVGTTADDEIDVGNISQSKPERA